MTYKYYSQTSSGWRIETDPDAPADKRWRITHPEHGERFFPKKEEEDHSRHYILEFTTQHMLEQFEKKFGLKK